MAAVTRCLRVEIPWPASLAEATGALIAHAATRPAGTVPIAGRVCLVAVAYSRPGRAPRVETTAARLVRALRAAGVLADERAAPIERLCVSRGTTGQPRSTVEVWIDTLSGTPTSR